MTLYTEGLVLKTVTDDDVNEVAKIGRFEAGPISIEEAKTAIQKMKSNHSGNTPGYIYHFCFAVCVKDKPDFIGWCGLDGTGDTGELHIFYMIKEEYRCRGYASQCAARLLGFAFEEYGMKHINGGCSKENIASYKVMKKAGMLPQGFLDDGSPVFYIDDTAYFNQRSPKQTGPLQ